MFLVGLEGCEGLGDWGLGFKVCGAQDWGER